MTYPEGLRGELVEAIRYRLRDEKSDYRKAVFAVDTILSRLEQVGRPVAKGKGPIEGYWVSGDVQPLRFKP